MRTPLRSCIRGGYGGDDVARIDECARRRWRRDRGLLEEARRMAGGGRLLDALPEDAAASNDVGDFGLVAVDFDGAGSNEVGGGVQIDEASVHENSFREKK